MASEASISRTRGANAPADKEARMIILVTEVVIQTGLRVVT